MCRPLASAADSLSLCVKAYEACFLPYFLGEAHRIVLVVLHGGGLNLQGEEKRKLWWYKSLSLLLLLLLSHVRRLSPLSLSLTCSLTPPSAIDPGPPAVAAGVDWAIPVVDKSPAVPVLLPPPPPPLPGGGDPPPVMMRKGKKIRKHAHTTIGRE